MSAFLDNWTIFSQLSVQQKQDIRLAIVFGYKGGNAVFVTNDDDVFGFGENPLSCLATGALVPHYDPKKIDILCGQKIESLEYVYTDRKISLYALTTSGSIFSWGDNDWGQLGLGTQVDTIIPAKIAGCLDQKKVVQVAVGAHHVLALTSEGEVFSFGCNIYGQLGLGHKNFCMLPQKVEGDLIGRFVVSVACEWDASVAVLDSGEVFAWGFNENDILGLGHRSHQESPQRVASLKGVAISRVICGRHHALALSTDGKLYSWGENKYGQLGIGTTSPSSQPTDTSMGMGKVKDFACSRYEFHPCAALTFSNEVYMWGPCQGRTFLSPTLTSFSSLDQVFATAASPAASSRPLRQQ